MSASVKTDQQRHKRKWEDSEIRAENAARKGDERASKRGKDTAKEAIKTVNTNVAKNREELKNNPSQEEEQRAWERNYVSYQQLTRPSACWCTYELSEKDRIQ